MASPWCRRHGRLWKAKSWPRQPAWSCGFSLRYELVDEAALTALLDEEGLAWVALYHACRQGLTVTYTKIREG